MSRDTIDETTSMSWAVDPKQASPFDRPLALLVRDGAAYVLEGDGADWEETGRWLRQSSGTVMNLEDCR